MDCVCVCMCVHADLCLWFQLFWCLAPCLQLSRRMLEVKTFSLGPPERAAAEQSHTDHVVAAYSARMHPVFVHLCRSTFLTVISSSEFSLQIFCFCLATEIQLGGSDPVETARPATESKLTAHTVVTPQAGSRAAFLHLSSSGLLRSSRLIRRGCAALL